MPNCGVSAKTGKGYHSLLPKIGDLRKEYFEVFLPELLGSDSRKNKDDDDEE